MKMSYQPEVDGLRTLAVLSVTLYHLNLPFFGGGYVGVDVFFVISGYLITRLIVGEIEKSGSFRFAYFYQRRVRRLFPALVSTIAFSVGGAFLLFSPEQMKNFGASAIAAVFSASNFYFWSQADYFDALATSKPLLHTWSLSVEEQFYLLWPAAIVLLSRFGRKALIAGIGFAVVASLVAAQIWLRYDTAGAFYLLPTRIMELGIGGLASFVRRPQRGGWLDLVSAAGLAAIILSIAFYTDETPFPGLMALLPCLGAAAFIVAGNSVAVGGLFRTAPIVWVGRISYSVYLVHWPLVVFAQAYQIQPFSGVEKVAIVVASIVLGAAQFYLVEERFRHIRPASWRARRVFPVVLGTALIVAAPAYTATIDGWSWRLPETRIEKSNRDWLRFEDQSYCRNNKKGASDLFDCQNYRGKDKNIVLWGDSHALHLVSGISINFPDYNVFTIYRNGCVPQSGFENFVRKMGEKTDDCIKHNRRVLKFLLSQPPTNIILSAANRAPVEESAKAMDYLVSQLKNAGHTVVVMGDFIRPGVSLVDCVSVPAYVIDDNKVNTRCHGDVAMQNRELDYDRYMAKHVSNYVSPGPIQCPSGDCSYFHDGQLLYRDDHHMNVPGSIYFIGKLKDRLPFRE